MIINREPIHIAARQGFTQIIDLLLRKGADINAQTIDGRSPLYEATCAADESTKNTGRVETVEYLLTHGAKPSLPDLTNRTPMHWACFYGHAKIVDLLLEHGADVNAADDEGVCPIHVACLSCQIDIVNALSNAGADLSAFDKHLRSPMHYAAKSGSGPVLSFLLSHRVNPDVLDDNGDAPIMLIDPQNGDLIEMITRHSDQAKARAKAAAGGSSSIRNASTTSLRSNQ